MRAHFPLRCPEFLDDADAYWATLAVTLALNEHFDANSWVDAANRDDVNAAVFGVAHRSNGPSGAFQYVGHQVLEFLPIKFVELPAATQDLRGQALPG